MGSEKKNRTSPWQLCDTSCCEWSYNTISNKYRVILVVKLFFIQKKNKNGITPAWSFKSPADTVTMQLASTFNQFYLFFYCVQANTEFKHDKENWFCICRINYFSTFNQTFIQSDVQSEWHMIMSWMQSSLQLCSPWREVVIPSSVIEVMRKKLISCSIKITASLYSNNPN